MILSPAKVILKCGQLVGVRGNFEDTWQSVADVVFPRKNDITVKRSPGEKRYMDLYDSTAMTSNELLAGALHGMLTNPAGYFFNFSTGDLDLDQNDNVRQWIQKVVRKLHEILNNSNFQTEVHEMYLDLTAFGTSCLLMEEESKNVVTFSSRPIGEIYIEENSKGIIDTLYRKFPMDARAMQDEFGDDALPDCVKKALKEGKPDKFEIIHAIYPRPKAGKKKTFKHAFVSQYVFVKDKIDLSVKGFNEFPFMIPRWTKVSGEAYGRGAGEKALPSANMLQQMKITTIKGGQKVVDPPLQAPDDGFLLSIDTKPAGISYYRSGTQDRIEPVFNDSRIDYGIQLIQLEQGAVREAFYTDQLKLREGPQMTATEVAERVEQALRFLGPMLGRQQFEFLQPFVERLYAIADRKGLLPDAPAELADKPLRVQYSSVMAMQQRMSEVQNIGRTMAGIAPFTAIDPNAALYINAAAGVKYVAKLYNFPQELIRKKEEVDAIVKQQAEQQARMQQQAAQAQQADSASKVITAASKAG